MGQGAILFWKIELEKTTKDPEFEEASKCVLGIWYWICLELEFKGGTSLLLSAGLQTKPVEESIPNLKN